MKTLFHYCCLILLLTLCKPKEQPTYVSCANMDQIQDTVSMESLMINGYQQLAGLSVPNADLLDLEGNTQSLHDLIEGNTKAIVLDFWFIGCAPCEAHLPHLIDLKNDYGDEVLFLSLGNNGPEQLKDYLQKKEGYNWDLYLADNIKDQVCVTAYPSYYILDKEFTIQNLFVGGSTDKFYAAKDMDRLRNEIDQLLSQ